MRTQEEWFQVPALFGVLNKVCVIIEVRDGDRDDAHLVRLEKCEILSTIMPMVEGRAAPPFAK